MPKYEDEKSQVEYSDEQVKMFIEDLCEEIGTDNLLPGHRYSKEPGRGWVDNGPIPHDHQDE